MPPILNPAPYWHPPRSNYLDLWHGCTAFDKNNYEQHGIRPNLGKVNNDFGQGFYTTTLERQARQWAWNRYYEWLGQNPGITANQPVIVRFRVRRCGISPRNTILNANNGVDQLASLVFVRGDYDNEEYWSLVQHCRQATSAVIHDHRRLTHGWYELVGGPVAAFWQQRVTMKDSDHFSFHQAGLELLNGDPDYYQWLPIP